MRTPGAVLGGQVAHLLGEIDLEELAIDASLDFADPPLPRLPAPFLCESEPLLDVFV